MSLYTESSIYQDATNHHWTVCVRKAGEDDRKFSQEWYDLMKEHGETRTLDECNEELNRMGITGVVTEEFKTNLHAKLTEDPESVWINLPRKLPNTIDNELVNNLKKIPEAVGLATKRVNELIELEISTLLKDHPSIEVVMVFDSIKLGTKDKYVTLVSTIGERR